LVYILCLWVCLFSIDFLCPLYGSEEIHESVQEISEDQKKQRTRMVLSLDGGGMRGIIGATIVEEIERQVGLPAAKIFDLFAGTSAGSITAVGLNIPDSCGNPKYSGENIRRLYEEDGKYIFPYGERAWFGGIFSSLYPAKGLEDVLNKHLGNCPFVSLLKPTIITAYDERPEALERHVVFQSHPFPNPPHDNSDHVIWGYTKNAKDLVRASAAAPTLFDPLTVKEDKYHFSLIDGGTWITNPGVEAIHYAQKFYPGDDIMLVSIGTGSYVHTLKDIPGRGLLHRLKPFLKKVFHAQVDMTDRYIRRHLITDDDHFFRFQPFLDHRHDTCDTSPDSLRYWADEALKLTQTSRFEKLISCLIPNNNDVYL
jgi:patatin-like phospholipase/acyl hydrolase